MGKESSRIWYDDAIYLAVVPGALGAPIAVATHTAVFVREAARPRGREVLNRAANDEEITITWHGHPVAVVVRPDIMWSRHGIGKLVI